MCGVRRSLPGVELIAVHWSWRVYAWRRCREDAMAGPVIAVVEDEPVMLELMAEVLTDAGYQPELWSLSAGALDLIRDTQPALVILDAWLEQRDAGCAILEQLRQDPELSHIPVIMVSADPQALQQMDERQAPHYVALEKPFDLNVLLATIRRLLDPFEDGSHERGTDAGGVVFGGEGLSLPEQTA